jgi:hypothetical protein
MTTIWYGRLMGAFYGYKPGRSYELSDGSRWLQDDLTDEPEYREQPTAKLLSDPGTGLVYLDVGGTSAIVPVFQSGSRPRRTSGAF